MSNEEEQEEDEDDLAGVVQSCFAYSAIAASAASIEPGPGSLEAAAAAGDNEDSESDVFLVTSSLKGKPSCASNFFYRHHDSNNLAKRLLKRAVSLPCFIDGQTAEKTAAMVLQGEN